MSGPSDPTSTVDSSPIPTPTPNKDNDNIPILTGSSPTGNTSMKTQRGSSGHLDNGNHHDKDDKEEGKIDMQSQLPPSSPDVEKGVAVEAEAESAATNDKKEQDPDQRPISATFVNGMKNGRDPNSTPGRKSSSSIAVKNRSVHFGTTVDDDIPLDLKKIRREADQEMRKKRRESRVEGGEDEGVVVPIEKEEAVVTEEEEEEEELDAIVDRNTQRNEHQPSDRSPSKRDHSHHHSQARTGDHPRQKENQSRQRSRSQHLDGRSRFNTASHRSSRRSYPSSSSSPSTTPYTSNESDLSQSGSESGSQSQSDDESESESELDPEIYTPRRKTSPRDRSGILVSLMRLWRSEGSEGGRRSGRNEVESEGEDTEAEIGGRGGRMGRGLRKRFSRHRKEEDGREDRGFDGQRRRRDSDEEEREMKRRARKKRYRWSEHALFHSDSRSSFGSGGGRTDRDGSGSEREKLEGSVGRSKGARQEKEDLKREVEGGREKEVLSEVEAETRKKKEQGGNGSKTRRESKHQQEVQPESTASSRRSSTTTLNDPSAYRASLDLPSSTTPIELASRKRRGLHPRDEKEYQRQRTEMKEDLNRPYLPAGRHGNRRMEQANFLSPTIKTQMGQRLRSVVAGLEENIHHETGEVDGTLPSEGTNRCLAALVITTSSLVGVASPQLAHLAPASGAASETSSGRRKLVMYTNPREEKAKQEVERELESRDEDREMGRRVEPKEVGEIEAETLARTPFNEKEKGSDRQTHRRGKRNQREIRITRHIADLKSREKFVLDLAKAVVKFGAPTHTVENWLEATAYALEVDASFIYFPSVLLVAFHQGDVHSSSLSLIRPVGASMDLYRLSLVHSLFRKVVQDDISVHQGSRALRRIVRETKPYHWSILILAGSLAAASASKVAFSGSPLDICMSAIVGTLIPFVQIFIVGRHAIATNICEITAAGFIAFIASGLGGTGYFCASSILSASIVLILPGWPVCLGALELGSRAIVPGAIRTIWAIMYTLFLSFTLSIGSAIFVTTGISEPSASLSSTSMTIMGSFTSNNTAFDNAFQSGTFTFVNGSSSSSVTCYRNPDLAAYGWYNTAPDWTYFIMVPVLAYSLCIWNKADWRSREIPVIIVVAAIGYLVNYYMSKVIGYQPNIVSACSAFAIGILANFYSRIVGGSAFPIAYIAILLEVPNSIAASGGLSISSEESNNDAGINSAVLVSIRLVQSGIALAVGLFAATVIAYGFGKKGRFAFAF